MNRLNMFYKLVFFLLLIIPFIGFNKSLNAQEFVASTILESSINITITNSEKVNDGIIVFGYYRGTLNTSPPYTADLFDMFLAKYDNDFQLLWIKSIGGSSIDLSYDLNISSDGSIYIAGSFKEKCGFSDTDTLVSDGLYDSFLAKYSSLGTLNWAKKIASNPANQYGTSIDIEENGDIIYGGYYKDSVDIITDKYKNTNGIYLVKLDNNGDLIWSKDIKTKDSFSRITTIRAYTDGYYINGDFQDTVFFDTGNEISENLSNTDVFLYKINSDNGNGIWLRRSVAADEMKTGAITSDNYGNIYYTGYFEGTSMVVDSTISEVSHTLINKGSRDVFVFKYQKGGDLIWAKSYGGTGEERARGIDYNDGFIYFTGYFTDQIIFDQDTLNSSGPSIEDIFIGVINRDGITIRAKSVEGSDYNDSGTSISIDNQNFAYLGGFFKSTTVQVGDSTYNNPTPGSSVLLLAKYKPEFTIAFTSTDHITCNGSSDGQLIVTPYFGAAPYSYTWSHNGTLNDSTATGLSAGLYSVTVTDFLDSTAIAQTTLFEPG
ncbi:MAG: SprB repeat-containing protein, partial [Bacteroidales bacterium]|nr:SprB repeat-containing protein [Bacteroidales bacterium]